MSEKPTYEELEQRIKKLEKAGYIEKYTALLNERKIGLKQTIFIF